MNKIIAGIIFGIIPGIIEVIPMILQEVTCDANLSAFTLLVVSGFII